VAAGLDVDKSDLKRYSDFVNGKIYDLLLLGQAAAKATAASSSSPLIRPLQGAAGDIHDFRNIDEQIELKPILDHLAALPALDLIYSSEPKKSAPRDAGASVSRSAALQIIDPEVEEPAASTGSDHRGSMTCFAINQIERRQCGKVIEDRFSSICSSIFRKSWILSCSPLVMGGSKGSMMTRPFAFAAACPRRSRS